MTVSAEKTYQDHVFTLDELEYWLAHPDQFFLPEHFEVVEGRVVETMPAGQDQGLTAGSISVVVGSYARTKKLGRIANAELGFRLKTDPLMVRCPDVAFLKAEHIDKTNKGFIEGAPDLAVEVVSPGDTAKEVRTKVKEYLEAGAGLIWVVYPEKQAVHVFEPGQEKPVVLQGQVEITAGEVIPGFSCRVSEVFE